jgi:hypothetical protein
VIKRKIERDGVIPGILVSAAYVSLSLSIIVRLVGNKRNMIRWKIEKERRHLFGLY